MTQDQEGARGESPATTASEQGLQAEAMTAAVTMAEGGEHAALPSILPSPSGTTGGGEDVEAIRREKR